MSMLNATEGIIVYILLNLTSIEAHFSRHNFLRENQQIIIKTWVCQQALVKNYLLFLFEH